MGKLLWPNMIDATTRDELLHLWGSYPIQLEGGSHRLSLCDGAHGESLHKPLLGNLIFPLYFLFLTRSYHLPHICKVKYT